MRGSQTWAGAAVALTALAALLVPAAHASMYEDMFMDDLMKRLAAYDDSYMAPEWYDDTIPLESRDNGQTNIRDQEYLEHSASHQGGFQYIQGGAGEGKQHLTPSGGQPNIQEIKSDDSLPFYCHPPNPCPKGYTDEDGCQTLVEDTAESQKGWINGMMQRGMCTCDQEHMFTCPTDSPIMDNQKGQAEKSELDKMLNSILSDKSNVINPYSKGNKINSLVAKKAPIVKRSIDESKRVMPEEFSRNGVPLWMMPPGNSHHAVVKKAGPMMPIL